MKGLVAALGILVLSAGPAVLAHANHTAGQRLTHGEWSIPADHQYETYEPGDQGRYVPVTPAQTLDLLAAGRVIIDRTDNLWVQHQSIGKNPMYLAATAPSAAASSGAGAWQRIHGTVQSVQGNTLTLRADDGRTLTVDMSRVNPNVQRAIANGEGLEVIGHYAAAPSQQHLQAQWIQQDSSNPARGGRVVGGQAPPVAAAPVPPKPAERGKVDETAWQRIHGKVEAVQGTTLRLKADDGRMISVDMSKVNANVRGALTQGEAVTVIGHYDNDRRHVDAQYIQQERAGGAASPRSDDRKR